HAPHVKLFSVVRSATDAQCTQHDLDPLVCWSVRNGLSLNLSKCFVISFSGRRRPLLYDYTMGSASLQRAWPGLQRNAVLLIFVC
ncbi:hypothetical protein TSAR_005770, partial [Trichomalopsis sarcophagae]